LETFKLFGKIDLKFQRNTVIGFNLLIVSVDLFLCIEKRVVGDL